MSSFQAGTYRSPSNIHGGLATITLTGPGASSGGGFQWSLATASGADKCTYPSAATLFVGTIANNPWAARLNNAHITWAAWSYGAGNGSATCSDWGSNNLLGFSQIGNTLTIARFTDNYGYDSATPLDQITYTRLP